ncbi:MAG TPA: ADOP family duplicated permease [Gemmatimonadaceae bacterium]
MTLARSIMRLARRIAYWLRFRQRQDELREELAFHRELVAADLERRGSAASSARHAMGNETAMREEARDVWIVPGIDALLKDCRHAWRGLRRTPVFTAVAVFTLAVGIGANTAIFSVVQHLLLAPLPFPAGNRIVRLGIQSASDPDDLFDLPASALVRLEQRSRTLEDFAAAAVMVATLGDSANHDAVSGARITPSLLNTLRVEPVAGRAFTREDSRPGAAPVAMIGYGLWQSRFGGGHDAVGQSIRVNGRTRTVVGITPRDLAIPMRPEDPPQIWLPVGLDSEDDGFNGYARLRPGATTAAALRELQSVMDERPDPRWSKATTASVTRAMDRVDPRLKRAVVVLFAAVSVLLLIACANIANLLFMRGWTRQRELAIRRALGGGSFRVARLLLIESSILALLGAGLGLLIAWKGLSLILGVLPGGLPSIVGGPEVSGAKIDGRVLAWTTLATITTMLLFGVGPAFFSIGEATVDALRTGIRGVVGSTGARRLRSGIVVCQIAFAFAFLVAAALLVKSFVVLARFDVGLDVHGLAIATIKLTRKPDAQDRASVERAIIKAVASVPGVTGAAFGGPLLITDIRGGPFVVEGRQGPETLGLDFCEMPFVSRDYFRVSGIPIIRGRSFEGDDDVVINQKLARQFWRNGDALGARMRVGDGAKARWLTVVGIAGDIKLPGVTELLSMQMYRPTSAANGFVNLVSFRSGANAEALESGMRRAFENAGVPAALVSMRRVESLLDSRVLARPRFALALFGLFASIALLLTAVGLYAVVAYTVTQRTREIGVRLALGADSAAVARMVLGDGIRHAAGGTVVGLILTLATTHLLASFVYDHNTLDPSAFMAAACVLIVVTLVASSIPVARALAIEPVDALRSD